jgi:peptidoglycan DL-endopeptidase CwlO
MPSRFRSPLLAVAFVALALALPPATAGTASGERDRVGVAVGRQAHPEGYPQQRIAPSLDRGQRAATLAVRMVGTPYRWGGESPDGGFDCSGLIRWSYGAVGVDVPHNSVALYGVGADVSDEKLETGDVLFFTGLGHVGLYLGGGRMVHAPYSGKHVEIVNLATSNYGSRLIGARRVDSG